MIADHDMIVTFKSYPTIMYESSAFSHRQKNYYYRMSLTFLELVLRCQDANDSLWVVADKGIPLLFPIFQLDYHLDTTLYRN